MASLKGKTFVLTGGASGIGLATAKVLASRGASLCIGDVNLDQLRSNASGISAVCTANNTVKLTKIDVRNRSSVEDFIQYARANFRELHGAANIAGIIGKSMHKASIWELTSEEYEEVMAVNARGVFNSLAEELRLGVLPAGSSIVNMASVTGLKGLGRACPYVASKHAVIGLTKAAAIDAAPRNIRVNSIAPGAVETPMFAGVMGDSSNEVEIPTPIRRPANPDEIAKLVAFLLSDDSSYITGATYSIDGGWTA